MTEIKKTETDFQFVLHHFKEGTLLPKKGWQRFKLLHHISYIRRNIAAASIAAVVLAASASIYYISSADRDSESKTAVTNVDTKTSNTSSEVKIAKIQFRNAPLKEVVSKIESVYDVTISNLPKDDIMVTISYEGTAADVVETLNELFDIDLKITPNPSED